MTTAAPKRSVTPKADKGTRVTVAYLSCQCVTAAAGEDPPAVPERCPRCGFHGPVEVAHHTLTVA